MMRWKDWNDLQLNLDEKKKEKKMVLVKFVGINETDA